MERQYIGARYVPIFADPIEWNDQRTYEPLTIVTYMGASYTSKKNVPVGIQPTNTEYWVITGNYNAQVEEYRQEVVEQQERVNENALKLTDVLVTIGDSYGVGFNLGEPYMKSWTAYIKEYLGMTQGVNYFTASMGSAGFVNVGDNGKRFIELLNDVISTMTASQKNSNVTVMVCGGHNDRKYNYDTIIEAINSFVQTARAAFNKCTVLIGMIGADFNSVSTARTELISNSYTAYSDCGRAGAHYITNSEFILCRKSQFIGDLYHPNENGQRSLASYLASAYKCGSCDITAISTGAITFGEAQGFANDEYTVHANTRNNITSFQFLYTHDYATLTPMSINLTDGLTIGTFSCDNVPNNDLIAFRVPVTVNVTMSSGTISPVLGCYLQVSNGVASIKTNWYNGSIVSFENVTKIFIAPIMSQLCVDTLMM